MGLFSKKEKVPEIPPAPRLPDLPDLSKPLTLELPSLPENTSDNLNQDLVKSAVSDSSGGFSRAGSVEHLPQDFQLHEEPREKMNLKSSSFIPEIPRKMNEEPQEISRIAPANTTIRMHSERQVVKLNEPVFVRIDKFQSAQKEFENIKKTVKEIEATLVRLKENREKEEAEITSWVQDLEKLKERMYEIDSNIFDKI